MKDLLLLQLLVVTPLALLASDPSHLPHYVICGLLALATAMAFLICRSAETAREHATKKSHALQAILNQLTDIQFGSLVLREALEGKDEMVALALERLTNTSNDVTSWRLRTHAFGQKKVEPRRDVSTWGVSEKG